MADRSVAHLKHHPRRCANCGEEIPRGTEAYGCEHCRRLMHEPCAFLGLTNTEREALAERGGGDVVDAPFICRGCRPEED